MVKRDPFVAPIGIRHNIQPVADVDVDLALTCSV